MVYLQINGRFQTHIFDFERPNRYCQHIYSHFHNCLQETGSDQSIYIPMVSFECIYPILIDPTINVNTFYALDMLASLTLEYQYIYVDFHISISVLRTLGLCSQSTYQRWLNVYQHIYEWF